MLEKFIREHGLKVRSGPFEGMAYVSAARGSVLLPKLMGIYEREIFAWVEELVAKTYDSVVDVGCAEGYYAVGLARRIAGARVYAFDIDVSAQDLCRELATLNGVADRVEVGGACNCAGLGEVLARPGRSLVVSDCEGYEDVLLDPANVPGLRSADLLIEVHEFAVQGVTARLMSRFAATHTLRRTPAVKIKPEELPELASFDRPTQEDSVSEFRPPGMEWLLLNAKSR